MKIRRAPRRILHVWSCAGVSSLIAEHMDKRYGTVSDVILTEKWDPFGLNQYRTTLFKSKSLFALRALIMARKYDLVHVHYHSIFVPLLKAIYEGPVIMHFHGSDVRENWGAHKRSEKADAILVSTRDLLRGAPEGAMWIPNPVDMELFSWREGDESGEGLATHFSMGADDEALALAESHGLDLFILHRKYPHVEIPEILNQFEYYIDVKRDFKGRLLYPKSVFSKTALEALSMGLKVIGAYGDVYHGFPPMHKIETVIEKLFKIYGEVIEIMKCERNYA